MHGITTAFQVLAIVGGKSENDFSNLVQFYNIDQNTWTQLEPFYTTVTRPTVFMLDGYIYVFGGFFGLDSVRLDRVERIWPESGETWEDLGSMKTGSAGPLVVPYKIKIAKYYLV